MSIFYQKVEGGPIENVTAFFPDRVAPIKTADSNHPYWNDIIRGLENNDEGVYDLFDVKAGLGKKLKALSERVEFDGDDIYFDGSIVNDTLSEQIVRFLKEGISDWEPLVKFWEKIATNPSEHSRNNLYRWLRTHDFSITMDGDIVGYKGVVAVTSDNGDVNFKSVHSGPATVNGVNVTGQVPNEPGSVITMPRAKVTANPAIGCHVGLHVGTWKYASEFAQGAVLEVHVNPRDVVSVPTDCSDAKMRVSRYVVVAQRGEAHTGAVAVPAEDYTWQGDVGYKVN